MGARDHRGKPEDTFEEGVKRNIKTRFLRQKSMLLTPKKRVNVGLCLNFKLLWVVLSLSVVAEACKCLVLAPGFCFCTLQAAKVIKLKCFDTCIYGAPFKIVPLTVTALRHVLKSVKLACCDIFLIAQTSREIMLTGEFRFSLEQVELSLEEGLIYHVGHGRKTLPVCLLLPATVA